MIGQGPFVQTLPPHIHSGDSPAKRYWLKSAALLPLLIMTTFFGGFDFLRILFLSVMSITGFEWLSGGFFKKKTTLLNGEAFLTGVIFAFLLPANCPAAWIVLGAFITVIIIGACFGGLGSRLFSAAIFGRIFLDLSFPWGMGEAAIFYYAGTPWMLGAILVSAVLFLMQRQVYFETPIFFIAIFLLGAVFLGRPGGFLFAVGISVFTATFLLTDFETLPVTRQGTNLFAVGAAILAVFLATQGLAVAAVGYAILIMNCLTPWLNVWTKPKAAKGAL